MKTKLTGLGCAVVIPQMPPVVQTDWSIWSAMPCREANVEQRRLPLVRTLLDGDLHLNEEK